MKQSQMQPKQDPCPCGSVYSWKCFVNFFFSQALWVCADLIWVPSQQPGQTAPHHARVCIQHVQPGQRSTQELIRPGYLAKPTRKSFPAVSEGSFASGEPISSSELSLACLNSATPTAAQKCFNRDHWVKLSDKSERWPEKTLWSYFSPINS